MADDITLTQPDLINRLLDNLPASYTKQLVKVPNGKFTTPKNGKWLRATVIPFNTVSDAATGEYKITRGLFVVDINYPKGSGDKAQLNDSKEIKELYENKTFNNTQCQSVSTLTLGDGDTWYTIQLNIEFYMAGF